MSSSEELRPNNVKFTNRKDCFRILMVKIQLKGLDPATVDFPEGKNIFVNGSLCPYYWGITNAKNYERKKVHQYCTRNG